MFKQKNYSFSRDVSKLRLTVDTEEDLMLAREIYGKLYSIDYEFGLQSILNLCEKNVELFDINSNVKRSAMYSKGEAKK